MPKILALLFCLFSLIATAQRKEKNVEPDFDEVICTIDADIRIIDKKQLTAGWKKLAVDNKRPTQCQFDFDGDSLMDYHGVYHNENALWFMTVVEIPGRRNVVSFGHHIFLDSTWQVENQYGAVLNRLSAGTKITDPLSGKEYIAPYDYLQLLRFDGHEIVFFYYEGAIIEIVNPGRME